MKNYASASTQQGGVGELIPDGTLCWAMINVRPHNLDQGLIEKPSKSSNSNTYLDCELTVLDGPYKNRKMWDMIGVAGSEAYVQMGDAAIRHILEVGRQASPSNPAGYQIQDYMALDGLRVAIKARIEKGKDGHPDKNRPRYLSPNPDSDTCKDYARLCAGDTQPKQKAAAAAPAAPPPPPAQGFQNAAPAHTTTAQAGSTPNQSSAPAGAAWGQQPGFQQPAPQAAPAPAQNPPTMTSPSNGWGAPPPTAAPGGKPGWLGTPQG